MLRLVSIPTHAIDIKSTDLVGAANHSVVVDSLGKGLPDLLFVYGCYNPVGGCSVGAGSGAMQGKASKRIYTNRNYGAAAGNNKTDYQPANMLQKVTNGVGVISQWDVLGRASEKVTPQTNGNLTVTYTYDGLKTEITTDDLSMSRSYNSLKQLVQTTDALGGITQ